MAEWAERMRFHAIRGVGMTSRVRGRSAHLWEWIASVARRERPLGFECRPHASLHNSPLHLAFLTTFPHLHASLRLSVLLSDSTWSATIPQCAGDTRVSICQATRECACAQPQANTPHSHLRPHHLLRNHRGMQRHLRFGRCPD